MIFKYLGSNLHIRSWSFKLVYKTKEWKYKVVCFYVSFKYFILKFLSYIYHLVYPFLWFISMQEAMTQIGIENYTVNFKRV